MSFGRPSLRVLSPAGIAGSYDVGAAAFGPALFSPGVTGTVVLGTDAANASGPSTTDGCTPLTNGAAVAGRIALLDRGTCTFVVKVKNAQDAGAVAVIIADNVAGSPPAGLGDADSTITISSGRVTLAHGNLLKANLAAGVTATLGVDMSLLSGADQQGRVFMFNPNPTVAGSSISHWDTSAFPNLLMEPAFNQDLTLSVKPPQDLTLSLMHDLGWYPDADNDGLADSADACDASDQGGTVFIGSVDTGVVNAMFGNGCTMADDIANAGANADNHGGFVSAVTELGNEWKRSLITKQEFAVLVRAAAQSEIGK
jgi:hypothetical protein